VKIKQGCPVQGGLVYFTHRLQKSESINICIFGLICITMPRHFITCSFVTVLLLAVSVVVFNNYFSLDEADILWAARKGNQWKDSFNSLLSDGRPVYAFFVIGSLSIVKTFAALKYLRILSILDLFFFCWLIFRFLKKQGMTENLAFITAALIFGLPGICVYVPWAECWDQHLASNLSFVAGILLVRVLGKHLGMEPLSRAKENFYFILSVVLQQVALLTYQNLALAFVLPAFFILILKPAVHARSRFLFFFYVGLSFGLSLALYYKIIQSVLEAVHIPLTRRAGFTTHYLEKLKWTGHMFWEAGKLNLVLFKSPVRYLFAALIGVVFIRDLFLRRFMDLFFVLAFCVMVFIPFLLVDESWNATRNFGLLSLVLAFYLVKRSGEFFPSVTRVWAATAAVFFVGIMCFFLHESWVKPQHADYEYMKAFVQKIPKLNDQVVKIEVIPPEWNFHERKSNIKAYGDEYNDPVFLRVWPIVPSINLLYTDRYPELKPEQIEKQIHVRVLKKGESFTVPAGEIIQLDLNYPDKKE
jgi:hypothetical protein